eukprot:jgi/Ulvmu1/4440/UM002_0165.1
MFDWSTVQNYVSEDQHTLQSLFEMCLRAHSNLDKLPLDAEIAQEFLNSYTVVTRRCARQVEALGLFSTNEDADDLTTASLRYILVSFFVAEGYADTRERLPQVRLRVLHEALEWYKDFISICERYQLIHPSAARTAQRILHEEEISDPHCARVEKIEQRRHERAIKEKLTQLVSALRISDIADVLHDCDEEIERELWSAMIQSATITSVRSVEMVRKELDLLKMKVSQLDHDDREEEQHCQENSEANQIGHEQRREEMKSTLMQIAKNLSSRQDRGVAVFKPSHNLPTVTVEQAGLMELEQMRIREEGETRHKLNEERRKSNLNQEEADAENLSQQRALDDWKDDHPAGYGNSKLRPCAL